MLLSVVIRSKDEAERLRLTLASLAVQTVAPEIIVVNDGSTDATSEVIAEAAKDCEIVRIDHATPHGRSAASNAGAERAKGDLVVFLDGDTLAAPDLVERHLEVHREAPGLVARGETYHLRGTRFFKDPETGSPMPGEEARVARLSEAEAAKMRVTRAAIRGDFASIDARAQPGIYPGAGPRMLYDLEMEALREHPDCSVLWAAASGSNQSVSTEAFLRVGGFDPLLTINEHRELALRLCSAGYRMTASKGRTYHMTHRTGWRDPLVDLDWEAQFYQAHKLPEVALLNVLWGSLHAASPYPKAAQITSLPELEVAARALPDVKGPDAIRKAHLEAAGG